jgi:ATP synthase protein I
MSSRTENGDAWRQHDDRTADRGPGRTLPAAGDVPWRRAVTSGGRPARQGGYGRPWRPGGESPGGDGAGQQNEGWSVFSYLISGMAVYGVIGWLVGHWTHLPFLFPVGMLTGLGLAILLIVLKYGRP